MKTKKEKRSERDVINYWKQRGINLFRGIKDYKFWKPQPNK